MAGSAVAKDSSHTKSAITTVKRVAAKAEAKVAATGVEMVAAKVVVRAAAKVASTATETETAREEVAREVRGAPSRFLACAM